MNEVESVKVLSRCEALLHLGISDRTLTRMEALGVAPPKVRLSPGRVGFRVADLTKWLEERREQVSA